MVWLPEGEKKFENMFIHFDRVYKRDGWTDNARRHRPRLCMASRGSKNSSIYVYTVNEANLSFFKLWFQQCIDGRN